MNTAIADICRRIVGDGGYSPDDVNAAAQDLPQTMRQLLDADLSGAFDGHRWRPDLRALELEPGQMLTAARPVDVRGLSRSRPKPPQRTAGFEDVNILFQWQILCRAVWEWTQGKNIRADLDHALTGPPEQWPLVAAFVRGLKKIGWTLEDLFGDVDFGEPSVSRAYLPLYNIDCDEDYVPVVVFLEEQVMQAGRAGMITLPEICRQTCGDHGWTTWDIANAEQVLLNILLADRLRLLSKGWREAIRAVRAFPFGYICFYDYEQTAYELEVGDAIDGLLEVCREVDKVTGPVNRLLNGVWNDPAAFWWDLAEQLDTAGKRHPELTRIENEKLRMKI